MPTVGATHSESILKTGHQLEISCEILYSAAKTALNSFHPVVSTSFIRMMGLVDTSFYFSLQLYVKRCGFISRVRWIYDLPC